MTEFYFDKRTQRYHYKSNNTFVGVSELRSLVNKSIEQNQRSSQEITQELLDKKISVGTWERGIAELIKKQTIQIGKLGKPELTLSDYGVIGNQLKKEYSHLRKFSYEILSGSQSAAQIKNRVNMYVDKATGTFEKFRRESHKEAGATWERRKRTKSESCSECIVYEAMGWEPIGRLPAPTERCSCRSRCGCIFELSWSREKPKESLLTVGFGWIEHR
jgi:hypothetical protein